MLVQVEGTDISFERASFTGREYRDHIRSNAELTYIDEIVEATLRLVVGKVTKGGIAYTGDYMDLDWASELMPMYYAAAKELVPKGPDGSTTDES